MLFDFKIGQIDENIIENKKKTRDDQELKRIPI